MSSAGAFIAAALVTGPLACSAVAAPRAPLGYVRDLPPEAADAKTKRHELVAARRGGPAIIVHRGAAAFAPENTLEAYSAAMDYGADGCEIDLRRTADGVLVLFHDDMLDHLTDGFGTVDQLAYHELLLLKPRSVYGTANASTRPPTFTAGLALSRQRARLLHLDVTERGLDADRAARVSAADVWDHVVAVNGETAPELARDPRVRALRYKAPGLYAGRKDMDPEAVRAALARPGEMLMVDDPRVAARALGRPGYRPVTLPAGLRQPWPSPAAIRRPEAAPVIPIDHLDRRARETNPRSIPALLALLAAHHDERVQPEGDSEYHRARTARILDRAWAAQRLGELGQGTARVVAALEDQVRRRSLHRDWMYHGLDGAMAARALGRLGATRSAPVLIDAFRKVDPALARVANPEFGQHPLSWTDFRTKMTILPALGELRCAESKEFLLQYVALGEPKVRELGPPQYEEATRALLRQTLTREQIESLLRSRNGAVRGTAIQLCLDRPTPDRTAALRAVAPWALELPRARGK